MVRTYDGRQMDAESPICKKAVFWEGAGVLVAHPILAHASLPDAFASHYPARQRPSTASYVVFAPIRGFCGILAGHFNKKSIALFRGFWAF